MASGNLKYKVSSYWPCLGTKSRRNCWCYWGLLTHSTNVFKGHIMCQVLCLALRWQNWTCPLSFSSPTLISLDLHQFLPFFISLWGGRSPGQSGAPAPPGLAPSSSALLPPLAPAPQHVGMLVIQGWEPGPQSGGVGRHCSRRHSHGTFTHTPTPTSVSQFTLLIFNTPSFYVLPCFPSGILGYYLWKY